MKKTLTVLMMVLLAAMLIVSCDGSSKEPKSETPTTPTTPAEPTPSTYMVTFRLGESSSTGSAFDAQEIVEGEKAQKPATNPIATDKYKTFDFWSADGATEFKFDETPITKDIVLQAVYRDYEVGDTGPAGGVIFFVATSEQSSTYNGETITWKCLEAAPADISGTSIWGSSDELCMGNKGIETELGKGWSNTKKLVSYFAAAEACRTYGDNTGYDDWFLPSRGELALMYTNRNTIGGFDTSEGRSYWTSSAPGTSSAYGIRFDTGNLTPYNRNNIKCKIRPIRAF